MEEEVTQKNFQPTASPSSTIPLLANIEFASHRYKKHKDKGTTSTSNGSDNSHLPRLPPTHTIHKRPILHPSIAAPGSSPSVQKVVYVSSKTPIMAAVKRVRTLLKRSRVQDVRKRQQQQGQAKRGSMVGAVGTGLGKTNGKDGGEMAVGVSIKASGRAIEQAGRVGEWFRRHGRGGADGDGEGWVVSAVQAGTVKVVDDIVEVDGLTVDDSMALSTENGVHEHDNEDMDMDMDMDKTIHHTPAQKLSRRRPAVPTTNTTTTTTTDSTTSTTTATQEQRREDETEEAIRQPISPTTDVATAPTTAPERDTKPTTPTPTPSSTRTNTHTHPHIHNQNANNPTPKSNRNRNRKRKRKQAIHYDADNIPEARTRFVDTVEIRVCLVR